MNVENKAKVLSEEEIDTIVVEQVNDDSAWEEPIHVRKAKPTSVPLSSELAARAAFFARLHLKRDDQIIDIDARPSDAIALGVAMDVPMLVEERVFEAISDDP